jgi:penicillin amidase
VRLLTTLLKLVLVLLLVVVIATGGLLGWVIVRGFPQRDGTARIPDLQGPVKVVRDENGIANIYASTPADLFAAEGYVHASERMWQMEVWRHIGAGRLSELFGQSQLDTDKFIRTLGWRSAAENDLAAMSADTRAVLDAYSRGVNAWLDQHGDLSLPFVVTGLLGVGGGLAGYRPEPWTALDTLTWQKVQAWSLGGNFDAELFRLIAAGKGLSQAQLAELIPPYDPSRPTVLPPSADAGSGQPALADSRPPRALSAGLGRLLDLSAGLSASIGLASGGSNGWVVSPDRSASGHALLANDPHLGISMPSIWYLVGLHCQPSGPDCPYNEAGASFPGVPGIVLGHNDHIAWGLTNVGPDVQDLFAETLDASSPDHYLYKGQSTAMTVRSETIKVRGSADVTIEVRQTVHGPLISDVAADLAAQSAGGKALGAPGKAYALEWTGINQPDLTLDAVLGVNRARNWQQFRDALRLFGAPSQEFLYADVDGNIGVQIPGKIPIRPSGDDGTAPVAGDSGAHDWTGYVPFDQLPYAYDPPEGLIVSSNNLPERNGAYLGYEFDPGWRAARILDLLEAVPKVDLALMHSIEGDVTLTRAAPIIAAMTAVAPTSADGQAVLSSIRDWAADPSCSVDSAGCAAFETFEYRLERDTFDDELGATGQPDDLAARYVGNEMAHEALTRLVADPNSAWFDDITTPTVHETRDDIIAVALDQAGADLRASLGDPANWTWGRIHTVTFDEQTLGESGVAPIELLFDKGSYPAPGSCTTVDKICGSISGEYPPAGQPADLQKVFAASSSPSYRLVIDMGNLDGATIIQTTGQSGLPFDAHYGDFIDRWLNNQPLNLAFSEDNVNAAARQTLTLTP